MLGLYNKFILFIIIFFLYNASIFSFLDTLLENRRVKKSLLWWLYIFNVIFFSTLLATTEFTATAYYAIIITGLFVELFLLYKETLLRLFFVTLSITMHIMPIRAIALGFYAILFNLTPYEANHSVYALDSMSAACLLLVFCTLLVKKYIPARLVKIIHQHREQLVFMTTWLFFANGYFLFNSLIFTVTDTTLFSKYNIVAVSFTMLLALYTVLLFTFKVGQLLGYKEKSDFFENIAEDEKQFKNSVIDQAILGFEANLTEDTIITGFGDQYENIKGKSTIYSELVSNSLPYHVHKDDLESVTQFMNLELLLASYEKGELEQVLEYRVKLPGNDTYQWIRVMCNLYKANATGSIMMFSYAKDIDVEKKFELEIKNRSERDTLTGLYNHGTTKDLVNDFVSNHPQSIDRGALFIIDIDNFKLVNDNFGHGFGDEVLHDISEKLLKIFRCNARTNSIRKEDDIVGRIGGDEFMVFVKSSNMKVLKEKGKQICELIHTTYTTLDDKKITISASVGIALVTNPNDNFKSLYAKADSALYETKRTGKDGFTFYNGGTFHDCISKHTKESL